MRPRSTLTVLSSIFLVLLFVIQVLGQRQPPYLTFSRPVNAKAHGLTAAVVPNTGGVLSLADQLRDEFGQPLPVSLEIKAAPDYRGSITVHQTGGTAQATYEIDYLNLVPIALFADSGATTLYTAVQNPQASEFATNAGLVEHPSAGYVALEFSRTRYANALYFLDLCRPACIGKVNDHVRTKLDIGDLQSLPPYMNADVGFSSPRPYTLSVRNGRAAVTGGLRRFYLTNVRGEVLAYRTETILRPPRTTDAQLLSDAFFLFETLVLLRAAKASDPEAWSRFLDQLSSDSLVQTHPGPWELYTRSFCSVYPDVPDVYDCTPWITH